MGENIMENNDFTDEWVEEIEEKPVENYVDKRFSADSF